MILTNHGKHLSDAFVDMRDSFSEIKVFTSNGAQVSLNLNLLRLFCPFLRGILESIPQNSAPALVMPDSSAFSISQIMKIFSSGVTNVGSFNYKKMSEIIDTGRLFGLDLSRISYEQINEQTEKKREASLGDIADPSSTLEETSLVAGSSISINASKLAAPIKTADSDDAYKSFSKHMYDAMDRDIKSISEKETKVKEEAPDNLHSFCEGIKGLIGKSLGIVPGNRVGSKVSESETHSRPIDIKKEAPEVYDIDSDEELQTVSPPIPHPSAQVQASPINVMYHQPMQMPIHMPMASSIYSNSYTMETPPPDLFPGYHHQNIVHSLPQPHPPAETMFISQEEYQGNKVMEFQKNRNERHEEPPRKKTKQAFSCTRCKMYETPHEEHFRMHFAACKKLNPKAKEVNCRICPFIAKNPVKYHKHIREEHIELVSACEYCEFTSFSESQLKTHIYGYHKWDNVPKQRPQPGSLFRDEKLYSCRKCNYEGPHFNALQQHKEMKHGKSKQGIKNLPSKDNSESGSLSRDNGIDVEDGELYSCSKCNYEGPNLDALKQHKEMKHRKSKQGIKNLPGKDNSGQKHVSAWRKEMGWGPDDKFTCDFWNFVGKGKCRMETGHRDDGRLNVSRHHVCALCFRNTGQKESHPAVFCQMFPLPEKGRGVSSHQAGEKGPSMADMGFTRGPSREERCSSREEGVDADREEGEVDEDEME